MKTVKEKLVELIAKAKAMYADDYTDRTEDDYIAETLLDNGVTVQEEVEELRADNQRLRDMWAKAVSDASKATSMVQEWISVKDRLPDDDSPVLVTCGRGYRSFIARYDRIWKRWKVSHTLKVTNWMPLPQPPKGE